MFEQLQDDLDDIKDKNSGETKKIERKLKRISSELLEHNVNVALISSGGKHPDLERIRKA